MPRKATDNGIARTLAAIIAAGGTAEAPRILKPASVVPKAQHAKRATSSSPAMAPATPPLSPAKAGKKAPIGIAARRRNGGTAANTRVRFDEAAIERVREFDQTEPTASVAAAPVYSLATDSEVVRQRAQRRLSEEEVNRGAQAFHLIFFDDGMANPRRVDTKTLLAKELRAELAARGLPTGGTRVYLQARLDQYLKNHGAQELQHTADAVAAKGSSVATPVLIDEEEDESGGGPAAVAKLTGAPAGRKRVTRTSMDAPGIPAASQLPPRPRTRGAVAAAAAAAAAKR